MNVINEAKSLFTYDGDNGIIYRKTGSKRYGVTVKGSLNDAGYRTISINRKKFLLHRIAFGMHHGYIPEAVDHDDGDRDNNRISNLIGATFASNAKNKKIGSNNKSGVMGVSWASGRNRWRSEAWDKGKCIYLGSFKSLFDAVCARRSAEKMYGYNANHGRR